MKKTLIFCNPEYSDLAIKLRDNYRAHDHEEADIVSVEEHDDIEYAKKMQYDEVVFIEDSNTVTFHDIESGYTNRLPVSNVFYNDPKPGSHEGITNSIRVSGTKIWN
jgi:alpha-acetolactate decarboxylase